MILNEGDEQLEQKRKEIIKDLIEERIKNAFWEIYDSVKDDLEGKIEIIENVLENDKEVVFHTNIEGDITTEESLYYSSVLEICKIKQKKLDEESTEKAVRSVAEKALTNLTKKNSDYFSFSVEEVIKKSKIFENIYKSFFPFFDSPIRGGLEEVCGKLILKLKENSNKKIFELLKELESLNHDEEIKRELKKGLKLYNQKNYFQLGLDLLPLLDKNEYLKKIDEILGIAKKLKKSLGQQSEVSKPNLKNSLELLFIVDKKSFLELYKKYEIDKEQFIDILALIDENESLKVIENWATYKHKETIEPVLRYFPYLNLNRYVEFAKENINKSGFNTKHLSFISEMLKNFPEDLFKDPVNNLIKKIVYSKYFDFESEKIENLREIIKNKKSHEEVTRFIDEGNCSSLKEIIENSNISVPGYQIISKIAEGGFNHVYMVKTITKHGSGSEIVRVLKIPKEGYNFDNSNIKEIIKQSTPERMGEISGAIQNKLQHPNITKFYHYVNVKVGDQEVQGIIEEFIQGITLEKLIQNIRKEGRKITSLVPLTEEAKQKIANQNILTKTLSYLLPDFFYLHNQKIASIEPLVKIFSEVTSAVVHLHNQKITHNDIKLDNIILDHQGRIYLTDFGVSLENQSKETYHGDRAYAAPEVLNGQKPNEKSDVWSLGVVMYQMMTGELPFKGSSKKEIAENILNENYRILKPKKIDYNIPSDLQKIIIKCLERDPDKRWSSKKVYDELNNYYESINSGFFSPFKKKAFWIASSVIGFAGLISYALLASLDKPVDIYARIDQPTIQYNQTNKDYTIKFQVIASGERHPGMIGYSFLVDKNHAPIDKVEYSEDKFIAYVTSKPITLAPGKHSVEVLVDPSNQIKEINEKNNHEILEFEVKGERK